MFTLRTARLTLRDLLPTDQSVVLALSREAAVTRYQTWLRFTAEDDARRWLQEAIRHNERHPRRAYNLTVARGQQVIGWLGFGLSGDSECVFEFGYALLPSAWGQGYMTEVLTEATAFMFTVLGAASIAGECETTNGASRRVMEKAGMRLAQTGREDGREIRRYALRRPEWHGEEGGQHS